jgi:UDP-2,3-diacylglucosamine pyrophosphatase LpxH
MFDAIIISDLHLGANNSQAHHLNEFLEDLENCTNKLILNGDVSMT